MQHAARVEINDAMSTSDARKTSHDPEDAIIELWLLKSLPNEHESNESTLYSR